MLVARLDIEGKRERRGALRFTVDAPTTMRGPDCVPVDVVVANISSKGFLIYSDELLEMGMIVSVGLAGAGAREARIVRRDPSGYGCQFVAPLTQDEMATAFAGGRAIAEFVAPDRRAEQAAADRRSWMSFAVGFAAAVLIVAGAAWVVLLR
jgi:hypothetical protein